MTVADRFRNIFFLAHNKISSHNKWHLATWSLDTRITLTAAIFVTAIVTVMFIVTPVIVIDTTTFRTTEFVNVAAT